MTFKVKTADNTQDEWTLFSYYNLSNVDGSPTFLEVYIDDDFQDGPQKARVYNMDHVISYGEGETFHE